jgi:hypothetical protein
MCRSLVIAAPDPRSGRPRLQAEAGMLFASLKWCDRFAPRHCHKRNDTRGGLPMFRITKNRQEPVVDVASYRQIVPAIRESGPGRYQVDQFSDEHSSRRWAVVTNKLDGAIVIEYEPATI